MFAIANGRKALWQWDLNQQLTVAGSCTEVHYLDKGSPSTLTVAVKDGKADIPNVLLQRPGRLVVYAYIVDAQDHHTKVCETFGIAPRPKPAEYVYTETEVKTWSDLQSQIGDLAGLATEEKDNLVAAINEVKASSGSGEASDAVLYTEQSLTEEQKAQARENIGGVRPVITLDYSFIGNGFTWNHTATEIQALKVKKYLFDVDGCQANCNFYAGNMRVSWVDGNELKYTDIDNSGKSGGIFTSDIGGITGQVTADKVTNPDHPTDLVQYGAFEAAVPLVQSMGITGAQVGQTIKVKAVNKQGMPTAWEAADMASGSSGEVWETLTFGIPENDPVSAATINLPSANIIKACIKISLFGTIESTKFSVMVFTGDTIGATFLAADIGNFYTNAQQIRTGAIVLEKKADFWQSVYNTDALAGNRNITGALRLISYNSDYLYIKTSTANETFYGTIEVNYVVGGSI